jgi:hypothetical protein
MSTRPLDQSLIHLRVLRPIPVPPQHLTQSRSHSQVLRSRSPAPLPPIRRTTILHLQILKAKTARVKTQKRMAMITMTRALTRMTHSTLSAVY